MRKFGLMKLGPEEKAGVVVSWIVCYMTNTVIPSAPGDIPLTIRPLALALLLAAVPAHAQTFSSPPAERIPVLAGGEGRQVAERLAEELETSYTDLAVGARYAGLLRSRARSGAYDRGNWKDLVDRVNADLDSIQHDGHLHLFASVKSGAPAFVSPNETDPHDPQVDSQRWIAPGVAYIRYHGFPGWNETNLATEAFLRDFAGAKAVIFDVRNNSGGGLSEMDRLFTELFASPTRLVTMQVNRSVENRNGPMIPTDRDTLRKVDAPPGLVLREHWAVPRAGGSPWASTRVYLLIGHQSRSAAEHFALALKRTHRATLIGQPTKGANHFGGDVQLTEHFAAFVPIGRTFDPDTGRDWEGSGVTPHVLVPEQTALDQALALERLAAAADVKSDSLPPH